MMDAKPKRLCCASSLKSDRLRGTVTRRRCAPLRLCPLHAAPHAVLTMTTHSRRVFAVLRHAASLVVGCPLRASPVTGNGPFAFLCKEVCPPRVLCSGSFFPRFTSTAPVVRIPRPRYVVSRGFAGFCAWTSVPAPGPASASPAVIENTSSTLDRVLCPPTLWQKRSKWCTMWTRAVHSGRSGRGLEKRLAKRSSSSMPRTGGRRRGSGNSNGNGGNNVVNGVSKRKAVEENHKWLGSISHMHRPTKDDMLAAATGFFQRLRIRTKWSLIRQMRPYNWEDVSAFFSWLFIGHLLWILLGTTTFMSVAILLLNTVFAQG